MNSDQLPNISTERNRDLFAAMRLLGSTPDAIADALEAKGIQGHRAMADACPVAVFLQDQFPNHRPIVSAHISQLYDRSSQDPKTSVAHLETPDPIARFITDFDDGKFPALISPDMVPDDDEYPPAFLALHGEAVLTKETSSER